MWSCLNCKTQIEDKHTFCWQCGRKRLLRQEPTGARRESKAPSFASFEQLAPEPRSHRFIFRRGLQTRFISYLLVLVIFVIFKILASRFFGTSSIATRTRGSEYICIDSAPSPVPVSSFVPKVFANRPGAEYVPPQSE